MAKEKDKKKKNADTENENTAVMTENKDNEPVKQKKEKKPFNKKKLKYGAMSTIITVVVVAVVVVINLIAGILTDRKGLKLDLTTEKYYEISQDTTDYLKTIKDDVEIAVILKESSLQNFQVPESQSSSNYYPVGKMVMETFDRFRQGSDHIKVNFYDMASNPDVITKFNYNGNISEGNIVIKSGDKIKVTDVYSLLDIQSDYYYGYQVNGYNGEQELISAVMSVTDSNPKRVALISKSNGSDIYYAGNAEPFSSLSSLLDKNGYEVTTVDIMNDAISPDDYDMAVLPAPESDLTDSSIKKLEDFLYNNGNLDRDMIYVSDYTQRETPNIDAFLEVWGIKIGDSIVLEGDENKGQYVMTPSGSPLSVPLAQYTDQTYTEGLSNTKLPVMIPFARPIELLFDSNVDRTTTALLSTSETAYLYPLRASADGTQNGPDTDDQAVRDLMAIAVKSNMDSNNNEHKNNVMVVGGASLFDSSLVSSGSYNNAEYIINSINKMCGKENSLVIAKKDFNSKTIDIKASQVKAISRVVIYIIPLIVVAAGIVVFLRRRNR